MVESLQRDTRLDLAKAIAILLVLFWHLQPIIILGTNRTIFSSIIEFWLMQFYNQITLIAVPVFILVFLYLYYQKAEAAPLEYLNKRWRHLVALFAFWIGCQFACFYWLSLVNIGSWNFSVPVIPIHRLLMQGGPPLPIVADSVFYFFFVLLILLPSSFVFYLLRNKEKTFLGGGVIIISLLYFEFISLNGDDLPYWRIDNFLIYIPFSYFLLTCKAEKLRSFTSIMWACFIIFSMQDIFLLHKGYLLGFYSRVSIVFGSMALFSFLLQCRNLGRSNMVSFLSKYSLGIFALHKYIQLIVIVIFFRYGLTDSLNEMSGPVDLNKLTVAVITTLLTFAAVYFAGCTRVKRFVM